MKKIVHIIIGLNVGGAELMLKRLVLHSQRKGQFHHEVISLTDLGIVGKELTQQGIPVHVVGMTSILSLLTTYFKLCKLLSKLKPDVVQTWMYHADFLGGLAAKSLNIKKIIWGIRTTDVTQGGSKLTVVLRSLCAKLSYSIPTNIVCAAHVSKDIHIKIGYDASKMHVIANGFELDKLVATEDDRDRIRQECSIPKDAIVIGSVGRFNVVKNQKFFVEVAASLVQRYPNLIFMLVGRDNTSNNNELMSWLEEKNLTENFKLLGQRSDIPHCLKAMDIFCLHSKTEGFPNVLGEAMAVGTLVTALNVGDSKYLLNNEKFIAQDKIEMLSILEELLININGFSETIIKNKDRIMKEFPLSHIVFLYEEIYLKEI
ncbi:glycosyltransferase family 4 protein [Acinetobacter albensis]|uniref:Glycosyltransferase family 4 protein n=1 Tax=Acinetobacter albensis TaxID=1673609 RepID=A0ABW9JTU5_9GAMM